MRRSEDWLSPGTTMQKRLAIMERSRSRCQSTLLPAPCACSLLHFSAGALGSPASMLPHSETDPFQKVRERQPVAHHDRHAQQQLPDSRPPYQTSGIA